jgi:hypothetical protein
MLLKIEGFRGQAPRLSRRLLAASQAIIALGVKLWSGELRAYRAGRKINKPSKAGTKQTLYRWGATPGADAEGLIGAVANVTPVRLDTTALHGLTTGARVFVANTGLAIDGATYTITVVDTDSFTLDGTTASGTAATGEWTKQNGYWFHWTADVDVARGPIAGDATERTVYTGDGVPKVTDSSIAVSGGGTAYPTVSYTLGIPAPAAALTPTPGVGGGCAAALQTSVAYVYTYVSGWGEEGPPSAASAIVQRCPGQTVDLSGMSTAPGGNYNIVAKRIYRAATGTTGTSFLFVAEIPVANTTYADTTDDENLGELLPSESWLAPPTDMLGVLALPNGVMAGFSKNDLCLSEAYLPHAWPIEYRLPTNATIVAIGAFGTSVVVGTTGSPYLATGSSPASYSMAKLELDQACVSKRGMVELHGVGVVYPSPDGLVLVGYGGTRLATENHFTRDEWQALRPATIEGYAWEGRYLGVYDDGGGKKAFLFDPSGELVFLTLAPTAGFNEPLTDGLYLQIGDFIERFDAGAKVAYQWRSKTYVTPRPANFGVGRVRAASYASLTFKLYGDGVLRHTQTVASDTPFRLPAGYVATAWEIEVSGTDDVYQVLVAEIMANLEAG